MKRTNSRLFSSFTCYSGILLVLTSSCSRATFRQEIKERTAHTFQANHSLFIAGRKANEDVSFSFLPNSALQTLTLESKGRETTAYTQIERPIVRDEFVQGHLGTEVKEDFTVATLDKLDLLLVVDNSSSMSPYQTKLSSGLKPLLSHISNTNWNIMVTTTSALRKRNPANPAEILVSYGCPRVNTADSKDKAVISRQDFLANPEAVDKQFAWKVLVGESGDPLERGLLAAVSAFQGECGDTNLSWIRPDSHKAVLMLTDEENCGSDPDQNCDSSPDSEPEFFLNQAPTDTQLFAMLYDKDKNPDDPECPDQGYVRKPEDYRALIQATNGMEGNICASSYESTLESISRNMHPVPRLDYTLGFEPVDDSLVLEVDGKPWNGRFQRNGRELLLESPLPPETKVLSVRYRHDAVPLQSTFTLSKDADASTLVVSVNNTALTKGDYLFESGVITLKDRPKELSRIRVEYREVKAMPKVFSLPMEVLLETVRVDVDGQASSAFQIVGKSTRDLVFSEAPRDGAKILISYETDATRTLRYPGLDFEDGEVSRVSAVDAATNAEIPVKVEGEELVFAREDVSAGRLVNVQYDLVPKQTSLAVDLKEKPIEGSLSVQASESGASCVSQMSLSGSKLLFPCPSKDLGRLQISYDYISSIDSSFRVNGQFTPRADWIVRVNGVETKDYVREDNVISFPGRTFETDTQIEVEVWELMILPSEG